MEHIPKLDKDILDGLHFWPDELEFIEADTPQPEPYKGFTIGLLIPNGGILGVSFWHAETEQYYVNLTEALDDFPGHGAEDEHIALAKAAIDAAMPNVGQMDLYVVLEGVES